MKVPGVSGCGSGTRGGESAFLVRARSPQQAVATSFPEMLTYPDTLSVTSLVVGETVYGITPGAPLPHRRSSFWKPAERDFNEFRTLLRTRAREEARRWGEERSSALTEEQAMAVLVRFARRVVALARIYRRIVEVYDRCLDEQSGRCWANMYVRRHMLLD